MGRTIKSKVKLEEIYFDEDLYPRSQYSWQTAYDYSESMKAGAKFPEIILALYKGRKYLVDGKHRFEAYKLLKLKSINAIVHTGWNREKIYKEAVKANIQHGRSLSPYEKRLIAVKLMEMKCNSSEISKLICVPQDKLESFVGNRLVNSITGEPMTSDSVEKTAKEIGQAILKSGVKQFAGQVLTRKDFDSVQETQKSFNMVSQQDLFKQVLFILEKDLLDKEDKKVMKYLEKIKQLLKNY